MPFYIRKFKTGYKVCKKNEPNKCFSNKPIQLKNAQKQLKAIGMNEHLQGDGKSDLKKLLDKNDIGITEYLDKAKKQAKKEGYEPELLTISDKKGKKLNYDGVNFGSTTNNDFIIYKHL